VRKKRGVAGWKKWGNSPGGSEPQGGAFNKCTWKGGRGGPENLKGGVGGYGGGRSPGKKKNVMVVVPSTAGAKGEGTCHAG